MSRRHQLRVRQQWIGRQPDPGTPGGRLSGGERMPASTPTARCYYYVAWNEIAGKMDVGSYSGNATDNRSITGVGFLPQYVIVRPGNANSTSSPFGGYGRVDGYFREVLGGSQPRRLDPGSRGERIPGWPRCVGEYVGYDLSLHGLEPADAHRRSHGGRVSHAQREWRHGHVANRIRGGQRRLRGLSRSRRRANARRRQSSLRFRAVRSQGFTTVGRPYTWTDDSPQALEKDVAYWIEDLDLNGKRTLHGPISPVAKEDGGASDGEPRDGAQRTGQARPTSSRAGPASIRRCSKSSRRWNAAPMHPSGRAHRRLGCSVVGQATTAAGPNLRRVDGSGRGTYRPATPATSSPKATARRRIHALPPAASTVTFRRRRPTVAPVAPPTSDAPSRRRQCRRSRTSRQRFRPRRRRPPQVDTAAPTSPVASPGSAGMVPRRPRSRRLPCGVNIRRPPVADDSLQARSRPDPSPQVLQQWTIASQSGVRVMVQTAGWYRFDAGRPRRGGNQSGGQSEESATGRGRRGTADARTSATRTTLSLRSWRMPSSSTRPASTRRSPTLRAYWIAAGTSPGLRLPTVDATRSRNAGGTVVRAHRRATGSDGVLRRAPERR